MQSTRSLFFFGAALLSLTVVLGGAPRPTLAATAAELQVEAVHALNKLKARVSSAKVLEESAKAILVFPNIIKAGLLIGGQYGEGVLLQNGQPVGYYNTAGASYGLQAGAQSYGYALFFMTDDALKYLERSDGYEIGVGPSVVVVDEGMGKSLTTTTAKDDVYAFIFSQSGLMAGLGVQGNKITKIQKH